MNWKKKLTTCTILIVLTTFVTFVINKFIYFIATLDNLLNDFNGNYYDWRFGKIYYTKEGSGDPIILIHDLTAQSSGFEWKHIVSKLAKTNTVYVIDLLGCGRSDKPNITYTNYLYVQMLTDFIKYNIGVETDIIASGESCSFVIMAAHNDTTIINKIIMTNPLDIGYLSLNPTKRSKISKMLINIPIIGTLLYNLLTTKADIEKSFYEDYFYDCSKIEQNDIKTYYECAHTNGASAKHLYASICGRYTNVNIIQGLKMLDNSIFIIEGSGTPNNRTIAEQYKNYLPSIEIFSIEKTKQLPHLENPGLFLETIKLLFEA